ncbi:5-formyltetrahydrofolate cyclo-ligase [Novosphingobium sp. FSY-8]|uniref:5-formyltetrahydrofolate cyclo-ligase n=1 Tax=Novosphingobium ovatum TaxID=1908523 RepID=A0ABW9XD31_9SPHN|nr:5-formyltetrahydrofolate cyclo-ligase [Novosphingobium ovatum]NBC36392.1 5-formyltetrahydrofolate cyclo-ligase [Novosphingobium ovatum]
MTDKSALRRALRQSRRDHVASLPPVMRNLVFLRPPGAVVTALPVGGCVALYHAVGDEAPTRAYGKWLIENGFTVALPWFAGRDAPMDFRVWTDPWDDADLVPGPWGGALQPADDAAQLTPDVAFVPLVGFTAEGARLGQGGGHYDRWLAAHPQVVAMGLAWDCQLADDLPTEPHDIPLRAVITPTRLFGTL